MTARYMDVSQSLMDSCELATWLKFFDLKGLRRTWRLPFWGWMRSGDLVLEGNVVVRWVDLPCSLAHVVFGEVHLSIDHSSSAA